MEHTSVDELMRRCPATIAVFLRHRMRCVGCPIGGFHSVEEACLEHGVDRLRVLADLEKAAGCRPPADSMPSPLSEDGPEQSPGIDRRLRNKA